MSAVVVVILTIPVQIFNIIINRHNSPFTFVRLPRANPLTFTNPNKEWENISYTPTKTHTGKNTQTNKYIHNPFCIPVILRYKKLDLITYLIHGEIRA